MKPRHEPAIRATAAFPTGGITCIRQSGFLPARPSATDRMVRETGGTGLINGATPAVIADDHPPVRKGTHQIGEHHGRVAQVGRAKQVIETRAASADWRSNETTTGGGRWANSLREWRRRFQIRLRDRRFWLTQLMVGAVTAGHAAVELFTDFDNGHVDAIYFVPASLYFFPVLYASLNFGREGAVPTAAWSALLAIPNVIIWHHGLERAGEAFQMSMMIFLAVLVAWRVDKEIVAKQQAQTLEGARGLSEAKYRALFNRAAEPILVLSANGIILEANAAALALFGGEAHDVEGRTTFEVLGKEAANALSPATPCSARAVDFRITAPDGSDIWLEPLCTSVTGPEGEVLVQVLLQDVTSRRESQHYAREITRAQEEERLRIAQELHDVSVQSAILICRRIDAVSEAVSDGDPGAVSGSIATARRTAEAMADDLRRFSRDLRPLILDDLGLVPALKRLLLELRERSAIDIRFDTSGAVRRLDGAVELAMFRIGQEALRNVENHARASRASMRIAFTARGLRLTVTDNGLGFVVPGLTTLVSGGRLGLLGMQERARLVGGQCEISSTPGKGTKVAAEVPTVASRRMV